MKKKIILLILAIIIVLFFLSLIGVSVVGFSTVSIDKNVYSIGEKINVSLFDFRLFRCSCSGPRIEFYRKTESGWEKINHELLRFGYACVDGEFTNPAMHCDVYQCDFSTFKQIVRKGNFTWDSKIYEKKEKLEICEAPNPDFKLKEPIISFETKNAPAGKYKVKFGIAQKIFEIKESSESQEEKKEETKDETAGLPVEDLATEGWQTYRNEEYGYETKYPSDWDFYKLEQSKEVQETTKRIGGVIDSVEFTPKGKVYKSSEAYGVRPIGIFVNINKPLQQFLIGVPENKKTQVLVNGIPTIEVKGYSDVVTHYFLIERSNIDGFIRIADHIYDIEKTGSISSEEEKEMHKIFDQMLSTFTLY